MAIEIKQLVIKSNVFDDQDDVSESEDSTQLKLKQEI